MPNNPNEFLLFLSILLIAEFLQFKALILYIVNVITKLMSAYPAVPGLFCMDIAYHKDVCKVCWPCKAYAKVQQRFAWLWQKTESLQFFYIIIGEDGL